jgi:UDP-N-acetylmuramoyl-tripeptide--D-alanyl-D-alanine ligase
MSAMTLTVTLEEVLAATGGRLVQSSLKAGVLNGITTDSRNVPPGSLFIGVPGERFDGSDYAAKAAEAGAAAVIVSQEKASAVAKEASKAAVIGAESTVRALGLLARWHRRRMQARIVAVTGSNGKTTTKEMIAAALSQSGTTLATAGNLNNEIGAPLTVLGLREQHRHGVIEIGMNHEGEIGRLTAMAEPHVGVVTMVAAVHTEALGGIEGVARAKAELYHGLPLDGVAVANTDDPLMRERARWAGRKTMWFGTADSADVRLVRIASHDRRGLSCVLRVLGEERTLQLPVVGAHNAMNACAAIAAALAVGAPLDSILRGLFNARPPGRRLRLSPIPELDATLLDDSYNANPSSAEAALRTLTALTPEGHRVAVLGDMRELGASEVAGHRAVGAAAAQSGLKLLVAFGPVSAHLAAGAVEGGLAPGRVFHTEDPQAAAARVRSALTAGDLVLVKASRGTRLERVADLLVPPAPGESH